MSLTEHLNQLDDTELTEALRKCCAAEAWVNAMKNLCPFQNDAEIETAVREIWQACDRHAWLAALAAHPRIGDLASLRTKYANTQRWASGEQSSVAEADEQTLRRLAELNDRYFEKFGFIFIICATGKTATEMVQALQQRLPNDPETELRIAADEQLKITLLRLGKLTS